MVTGRMVARSTLLLTLLLGPLGGTAIASNGAFAIATSPRAAGRGGTDVAVADDAYAIITNPAGMTQTFGYRLDVSFNVRFSNTTYVNAFNDDEVDGGVGVAPAIAFVYDFGHFELDNGYVDRIDSSLIDREVTGITLLDGMPTNWMQEDIPLDLGIAIHGITGTSGSATYRSPVFTEGESERSDLKIIGMSVGASYRVGPHLSLGIAFTGMYSTIDQAGLAGGAGDATAGQVRNFNGTMLDANDPNFTVNGEPLTWSQVFAVAGANDSFASGRIDIDDATGFGASAIIGVLAHLTEWLSVGISYRTPGFFSDIEGEATVDSRRAVSASEGLLNQIQANFLDNHLPNDGLFLSGNYDFTLEGFRLPQIVAAGVAVRPHWRLLLTADVKWINWSDAFDEFDVILTNGDSADLNEITGSSTIRTKQIYRWDDQFVIAGGAALAVTDWLTIRCGYNYGNNPVPDDTATPFSAPVIEHHATLGIGMRFGSVSLDFAYVHGFAHATTIKGHVKSPEFNDTRQKADQNSFWLGFGVDY